jgi:uncharacterized phiE125 gp8 family phage protein
MKRIIVSGPATQAVSNTEVKNMIKIDHSADDTMLTGFIKAASRELEDMHMTSFITQTLKMTLAAWPEENYIDLLYGPVQSITHIKYLDIDGTLQTLSNTKYALDNTTHPHRVRLNKNESWPAIYSQGQDITITYIAGYGAAADVPDTIKVAIMLRVAEIHTHPENPMRMGRSLADNIIQPFSLKQYL